MKVAYLVAIAHAQNKRRFVQESSPSQPVEFLTIFIILFFGHLSSLNPKTERFEI